MAKRFIVDVDATANAAYIGMSDEEVVETVQLSDEVLVDFDAMRVVVGIELLRIDADIPFQRLIDECHVHSDDVEALRNLRPSVSYHLRSAAEGTTHAENGILTSA